VRVRPTATGFGDSNRFGSMEPGVWLGGMRRKDDSRLVVNRVVGGAGASRVQVAFFIWVDVVGPGGRSSSHLCPSRRPRGVRIACPPATCGHRGYSC
jgi:hypothetical protein